MNRALVTTSLGLALAGLLTVPSAPLAAQGAPAANASDRLRAYRINPGDSIEIYVWGEERLQRTVRVLPDGTISFPLVGQLQAAGKLPHDIEVEIGQGLKSQFRETVPQVTVSVKDPSGLAYSVAGKVKTPGTFFPGRYINALEAVTMAGGPTDFANVSEVTILRKIGGRVSAIKIRLTDVLKGNPSERDLASLAPLESGDTVIVP